MEKYDEDKELRQLIKGIRLDKPAPDFSTSVMNRIFQERSLVEQVKSEPLLSKGFWIIVALFGILLFAIILLSGNIPSVESESLLPELSSGEFMSDYRTFFKNLGSLPSSIAGITFGLSILVFLERYLNSKNLQVS